MAISTASATPHRFSLVDNFDGHTINYDPASEGGYIFMLKPVYTGINTPNLLVLRDSEIDAVVNFVKTLRGE